MSSLSRKDFLRLSSLSFLATLLPTQQVNAMSFILGLDKPTSKEDYNKAKELAKVAKMHFFKKEYQIAIEKYKECIKLAPRAICFYDGLDNVFGAQGQFLDSLLLYKNGLEINLKNVAFYDRMARALMRVELSDRKLASRYKKENSTNSMLQDALHLYNKAIAIDKTKQYLFIGKDKIEQKIAVDAVNIDFRKNKTLKSSKRKNAIAINVKNRTLSKEIVIKQLERIASKKRNVLYFEKENSNREKKIIESKKAKIITIIDQLILEKDFENALNWSKQLFALDSKSQHALLRLKKSFYRQKKYQPFIKYRLEYAKKTENVFSYLGVLDTIEQAIINKEAQKTDIDLAHSIGEDLLKNWNLVETIAIDVIDKYNKILILDNKINVAKSITTLALKRIESKQAERVNKILYSYSSLFFAEANYYESIAILKIALKESIDKRDFSFDYDTIKNLSDRKINSSFKTNKPLYTLLFNCYDRIGNKKGQQEIISLFKTNDSNDSFLKNKI